VNNLHFSYSGLPYFTKKKNNQLDHYYFFASSGGSRANEEGTSDANESEAMLTKGQRVSTWLSLRSASRPDPSNSSSDFSSVKCDKAVTNAGRLPHQTPLAAAVLIRFSVSSTTMDRDVTREDSLPASPSIRSQTSAVDV
jgi:hypothetical protein